MIICSLARREMADANLSLDAKTLLIHEHFINIDKWLVTTTC